MDYVEPQLNENLNPIQAVQTYHGYYLTPEESLFIHYIVSGMSNIEAYVRAGIEFPRKPISQGEKSRGITSNDKHYIKVDKTNRGAEEEEEYSEDYTNTIIDTKEYINTKGKNIDTETEGNPGGGEENKEENSLKINPQVLPTNTDINTLDMNTRTLLLQSASELRAVPRIAEEIVFRIKAVHDAQVADEHEIYAYFTAVMRGQIKDQFGLDASLQERTRAAEALAKRVIDLPRKVEAAKDIERLGAVTITIEPRHTDTIDAEYTEVS